MPMMLVKLKYRNGRKFKGSSTMAKMIFHCTDDKTPWNRSSMESAKSTIRATQAASNSSVNKTLVAIRAFRPKDI